MIKRLVTSLFQSWQKSALSVRLMFPIAILMTTSLIVSTVVFVTTTARTQDQIFEHETETDMLRVVETLRERTIVVATAGDLLANDSLVREALGAGESDSWQVLNARAVVVRDRMDLDLVQIYDATGEARANLLVSSLYRQSSLLDEIQSNSLTVRAVDDRLLLLCHSDMPGNEGAVITGIDLETELRRVAHSNNMVSDLGLTSQGIQVATWQDATTEPTDVSNEQYITQSTILLADAPVTLTVARVISDIRQVISAGLRVMTLGSVVTTLLLMTVGIAITRRTIAPVHHLAEAARQITRDNLSQHVDVLPPTLIQDRDTQNEINLLAQAFSLMMTELRGFYQELEDKVESRTRELMAAEDRYRRFFEEDLAGTFVCDPDGCFVACNRAFAQIFGYESVEDALGVNVATLFPDPDQIEEPLNWLREQKRLGQYETELCRQDGQLIPIIANVLATFDENHCLSEIHGYVLDNSKQKSLEEQLRQSQKMEAVGRLAGGVAHDFNNLLTVIIGHCQLLKVECETKDHADIAESPLGQIENIHQAAQRAAKLTRQLLAFSRRQVLQPETLSLNDIVNDMSKMLARLIGEDIELVTRLPTNSGLVYADPSQMEQVIMNLAVNSRDAMPAGGRLTIETRNEYLDAERAQGYLDIPPGRYIVLSITDTGCGMDRKTRERIFEPFFTTKQQGTGLGLSTVYGIVKQSNGQINVYSEPGHGTTFKIYLPCSRSFAEHTPETQKPVPEELSGTETVLLVEDEDMVRDLAGEFLRRNGYTVVEASDGESALAIIKNGAPHFDLIITDVVMPRMGGHDLIARVKEQRELMKVLFMSGYTEAAIIRESVLEPGMGFIQKPFTPQSFLKKIRDILSNHSDHTDHDEPGQQSVTVSLKSIDSSPHGMSGE